MATLIVTIIAATFVAVFAGFNIDNSCDVSVVVYTFRNIPVFVTALVAFALGTAVSLPIAIRYRKSKSKDKTAGTIAPNNPNKKKAARVKKPRRFALFKRTKKAAAEDVASQLSTSTAPDAAPSAAPAPSDTPVSSNAPILAPSTDALDAAGDSLEHLI